MTNDAPPSSPLRDEYLLSALDWQRAFVDSLTQAQRNQYQMLAAWQKSLCAVNQDLWDQWVCRFGGGVPLDG
ncbi:MAG: hypothetical protein EOP82_09340 [Variovorax sp.]|nr:MAG: hypothetical protein EOP82_09340 [Variovorax sp.]